MDEQYEAAVSKVRGELIPSKSAELYEKAFESFRSWLNGIIHVELNKLTPDVMLLYVKFLKMTSGYAPSTIQTNLSMVKNVLISKSIDVPDLTAAYSSLPNILSCRT